MTGTPASWACWRMRYSPTGERQMLPVQTVMIRYMVLVYRWGRGWLSVVGAWDGFVGGTVTGGCARRRAQPPGLSLTGPGRRKGPADEGPAGPFRGGCYSVLSSSTSSDSSRGFAGSLTRVYSCFFSSHESGSKSTVPTGISKDLPRSVAVPRLIGLLPP